MSAAQQNSAKQRWDECRVVASALGVGHTFVHDKLYSKLKAEGFLELVVAGDSSAIQTVKEWPEILNAPIGSPATTNCRFNSFEKLKIAQWFVERVGGIAIAKRALEVLEMLDESL